MARPRCGDADISGKGASAPSRSPFSVQGLKEHGWIEGHNITFEYRFVDGKQDALPKLAAELVRLRVDAVVAEGTPAIQAAKDATQPVPIVGLARVAVLLNPAARYLF
jgi:putative tryptophan/tyrosine transport system substrate-binding protein